MRRIGSVMVLAAAVLVAAQTFWPPSVGLANNGDFSKVIGYFDLGAPPEDEFGYADTTYRFEPRYHYDSPNLSSETLLAALAIKTGRVFSLEGTFDLRWMGLLHALLLVASVALLQPCLAGLSPLPRVILSAAILLVFCDVMYVSYLNSFYMDTAAYLFLLLSAVLFLRIAQRPSKVDAVLLLLSLVLLLTTKPQHAVLGVWLLPLFAMWPGATVLFRALSTCLLAVAIFASAKMWPPEYAPHGYYSVIFIQVLPHSSDVSSDLRDLGLDDSYKKWAGTHAYSAESGMNNDAFVREFMRRTSYTRLAWYFATHPSQAYLALTTSLAEGGRQRPPLGNFDKAAGLPPSTESNRVAVWSDWKRMLFHGHGARYLGAFLGASIILWSAAWWKRKALPPMLLAGAFALGGMSVTAMAVASLADAVDVTRHFLIPSALLDLELVSILALLFHHPPAKQQ